MISLTLVDGPTLAGRLAAVATAINAENMVMATFMMVDSCVRAKRCDEDDGVLLLSVGSSCSLYPFSS